MTRTSARTSVHDSSVPYTISLGSGLTIDQGGESDRDSDRRRDRRRDSGDRRDRRRNSDDRRDRRRDRRRESGRSSVTITCWSCLMNWRYQKKRKRTPNQMSTFVRFRTAGLSRLTICCLLLVRGVAFRFLFREARTARWMTRRACSIAQIAGSSGNVVHRLMSRWAVLVHNLKLVTAVAAVVHRLIISTESEKHAVRILAVCTERRYFAGIKQSSHVTYFTRQGR